MLVSQSKPFPFHSTDRFQYLAHNNYRYLCAQNMHASCQKAVQHAGSLACWQSSMLALQKLALFYKFIFFTRTSLVLRPRAQLSVACSQIFCVCMGRAWERGEQEIRHKTIINAYFLGLYNHLLLIKYLFCVKLCSIPEVWKPIHVYNVSLINYHVCVCLLKWILNYIFLACDSPKVLLVWRNQHNLILQHSLGRCCLGNRLYCKFTEFISRPSPITNVW